MPLDIVGCAREEDGRRAENGENIPDLRSGTCSSGWPPLIHVFVHFYTYWYHSSDLGLRKFRNPNLRTLGVDICYPSYFVLYYSAAVDTRQLIY